MTSKDVASRTAGRLITADDVAARLAEHVQTIRKRTRRGEFDSFAINIGAPGRPVWRYDEAGLERWLALRRAA